MDHGLLYILRQVQMFYFVLLSILALMIVTYDIKTNHIVILFVLNFYWLA